MDLLYLQHMKNAPVSRKTLDMLHDNGYSLKQKSGIITIKRSPDNMAIIVLIVIIAFASIPLFAAGIIYGIGLVAAVMGAVFIRRKFFSKKSSLVINLNKNTFTAIIDTIYIEDQPLKTIDTISVDTQFLGEYTSATRSHQEEHLISISMELITKEVIPLFKLKSDHSEPSREVNEVFNFLEDTLKEAKAA